jgi:anti-anti-sigma factor
MDYFPMEQAGCGLLQPAGTLHADRAPDLDLAITRLMEEGCSRLVIDLSRTGMLSGACLDVLVAQAKTARRRRGLLALSGVPAHVFEMLEDRRMATLFPIFENDAKAARYFAAAG